MAKKTPQTLSWTETEKLLHQLLNESTSAESYPIRLRNYAMALLMLDAGLRVGELINLRIEQLIINNEPVKSLKIEKTCTKSKSARMIPLTNKLQHALQQLHDHQWINLFKSQEGYAFRKTTSELPFSARQVQRIIEHAAVKSIGHKVNPHMLRHTFASRLMRQANSRVVQELLGHENLSSTQIYTHPNGDDLKKAIDSMEGSKPLPHD